MEASSSSPERAWRSAVNHSVADRVVPLHADYCLSRGTDNQVCDGQELFCLGNFAGDTNIASLVLRKRTDKRGQLVYNRVVINAIPPVGRRRRGIFYAVAENDPAMQPSLVWYEVRLENDTYTTTQPHSQNVHKIVHASRSDHRVLW